MLFVGAMYGRSVVSAQEVAMLVVYTHVSLD